MNHLTEPVVFGVPTERCKILPILMKYDVLNIIIIIIMFMKG